MMKRIRVICVCLAAFFFIAAGCMAGSELSAEQMFVYGNEAYLAGRLDEAADWYRMAAEQGNLLAAYIVEKFDELGMGVPQDPAGAGQWFVPVPVPGNMNMPVPKSPEITAQVPLTAANTAAGGSVEFGTHYGVGIEWYVSQVRNGQALLISMYPIEQMAYQSVYDEKGTTWGNSDVNNWLNNTFYNEAFTPDQQLQITANAGSSRPQKIKLLAASEVEKLLPASLRTSPAGWWVCDAVQDSKDIYSFAKFVNPDGIIGVAPQSFIYGVRPVMWVTLR